MAFLPQPYQPQGESIMEGLPWTLPSRVYSSSLDGSDFDTFPEQSGWHQRSGKEWDTLVSNNDPDFNAFLQTWLLSGLLSFMFQEQIDLAALIPEGHEASAKNMIPADRVLTPEMLAPLVEELRDLPGSHEGIRRRRRGWWKVKRIHDKLDTFGEGGYIRRQSDEEGVFQYTLESWMNTFDFHDPRPPCDRVLLDMLLVFFDSVLWQHRATDDKQSVHQSFSAVDKLKPVAINKSSFAFLGGLPCQCPSAIYRLYTRLESPAYWYFLHMRAWSGQEDEHKGCSIRHCELTSVDDGNYRRRHFECCCGSTCKDLHASQSALLDILQGERLPLVRLRDEEEDARLDYVSSTEQIPVPYVAISHVWSDGLGHDSDNALYACQFQHVSNVVRGLTELDVAVDAVWMDTLCVPRKAAASPGDEAFRKAKRKAISFIQTSFLEAAAVVVLDAWLMSMPLGNLSDTEILMRILNSPWNTRLWTFQEGAMARKLLFQFSDCLYDIDAGMARLRELTDVFVIHTLKRSIDRLYTQLRGFYREGCCVTHKLNDAVKAVQLRSSTLAADEPLCLAALLDMDLTRLAPLKDEDRMVEFWRMVEARSFELFILKAKRLQTPGFRWAPQSLLLHYDKAPAFAKAPDTYQLMSRSEHAGVATRYGFHMGLLDNTLSAITTAFDLGSDPTLPLEQVMFHIEADLTTHPSATWTRISDKEFENPKIEVLQHYGTGQVVFILLADERSEHVSFGALEQDFGGVMREGFLVALRADVDNTMIRCGEIKHRAELPCDKCTPRAERPRGESPAAEPMTIAQSSVNALHGDCGELRPHEHWKETIYICPARMRLLPDIQGPNRTQLHKFRDDFNAFTHARLADAGDLHVPFGVSLGRWQKEYWRIT